MFNIDDEIKFSEEGLEFWVGKTEGRWADKCRLWRWRVLNFLPYDCVRVIRLDIKNAKSDVWHESFFELA